MRCQNASFPVASLPVRHGIPTAELGSCQPTVLVFLPWLLAQGSGKRDRKRKAGKRKAGQVRSGKRDRSAIGNMGKQKTRLT